MIEHQSIISADPQPEQRNPLSRILCYVTRVVITLAVGVVLGVFYCAWHLAFFLLCMFRPVVNMVMLGGVMMPLIAFVAFVKPEAANGMPFWVFLLMAAGIIGFALGYSKFIDRITPPGETDPFERYRRRDRR